MTDPIEAFSRRVGADPWFLAAALADFAASEGLDRAGLALTLGCEPPMLGPLGLCRRPRTDPPHFGDDVRRIAHRFGIREELLAEVVRRSDVLAGLRGAAGGHIVAAARDRLDTPPSTSTEDAP